jgi:hypothetical protein
VSITWFKGSTFQVQRLDNSKNKSDVMSKNKKEQSEAKILEPLNREN